MAEAIDMVVSETAVHLTKDKVLAELSSATPGPIRTHAVDAGGRLFPVKEAFALVTGLDVLDFNTNQARRAFKRLGLPVVRVS